MKEGAAVTVTENDCCEQPAFTVMMCRPGGYVPLMLPVARPGTVAGTDELEQIVADKAPQFAVILAAPAILATQVGYVEVSA